MVQTLDKGYLSGLNHTTYLNPLTLTRQKPNPLFKAKQLQGMSISVTTGFQSSGLLFSDSRTNGPSVQWDIFHTVGVS